ncbi:hypothetical protein WOC76_08940 [Methylocystis sp. IM3]|jgi:hypothetical protein|uniref:hypothetical protein n=1 Tax=unclassified Methylocystis TaxID=2625913 RepID=UPI000F9EA812|nr:MAG: hypothetical protein EKK29_02925 [Hyphomicrobiales bacterium]
MRHFQAEPVSTGPDDRPAKMLAGYLCNISRGPSTVRRMILNDIGRFAELGADGYVSDLVQTLRLFDRAYAKAA